MATDCTVDDAAGVLKGDALCLVGWDTTPSPHRPKVARATSTTLGTSKTVYGIAKADAADTATVTVLVAGDVADDGITSLGAGDSRIIATDISQAAAADQCRLIRVDRPDGSEHVVGTCDESGNLAVQPRASRETSSRHVFSVKSYGARGNGRLVTDGTMSSASSTLSTDSASVLDVGKHILVVGAGGAGADLVTTVTAHGTGTLTLALSASATVSGAPAVLWATDDTDAISAAIDAIPSSGGVLFFPASEGAYVVTEDLEVPAYVQVHFDEGAMLMPAAATVTIAGAIVAQPTQHIFDGVGHGTNEAVRGRGSGPLIGVSGSARLGSYSVAVRITTAGTVGNAEFEWSSDGGLTWNGPVPTASSYVLPGLGIVLSFPAGTYTSSPADVQDTYGWGSTTAVVLAGRARSSVIHSGWFGTPLDGESDDAFGTQVALDCIDVYGSATVVLPPTPPGVQAPYFQRTVRVRRGHIVQGAAGTQSNNGTVIYAAPLVTAFVVESLLTSDDGGRGTLAVLRDFAIEGGGTATIPPWTAEAEVEVGDRAFTASVDAGLPALETPNAEPRYYLEAIVGGTTGASPPANPGPLDTADSRTPATTSTARGSPTTIRSPGASASGRKRRWERASSRARSTR